MTKLQDLFAEALGHHQAGRLPQAEQGYRRVLELEPRHADALHLLGLIAHQVGRNDIAVELIAQAIGIDGSFPVYRSSLGAALAGLGRAEDAVAAYNDAIRLKPDYAEAHSNLGNAFQDLGRLDEAVAAYEAAIAFKPDFIEAHYNLGHVLQALGRPEAAVAAYGAAVHLKPDFADAHARQGAVLADLGRAEEAAAAYTAAVQLRPDFAEAHLNLGNALADLGRLDEALAAQDTAIRLAPGLPQAHYNRGNILRRLGRLDDAVDAYDAAIRLDPGYAQAHANRGAVLTELARVDEAAAAYGAAIRLKPDYAEAHYNEAFLHLLRGDLAAGWPKYEWRRRGGRGDLRPRDFTQPQWQGEDIAGRTILLHAEQGLGDAIQFCRYAPRVAARGARVVLEAPRPLLRLLSGLAGVDRLVATGDSPPAFDLHCPLMSLPGVFGTTLETIPADIPYLSAEGPAVEAWRARIGATGFKVGITWQGNPTAAAEQGRSVPLAAFAPLSRIPGVRLISLQKVHGLDQLEGLPAGMRVETLGEDFDAGPDAFVDTAGAMAALDMILTVDTAVGHLAGALGRPVWLALQQIPHWVWTMQGERSPWYPNTRLFRQAARGDWSGVFARMEGELAGLVAAANAARPIVA